jgi:hypothetical protein
MLRIHIYRLTKDTSSRDTTKSTECDLSTKYVSNARATKFPRKAGFDLFRRLTTRVRLHEEERRGTREDNERSTDYGV